MNQYKKIKIFTLFLLLTPVVSLAATTINDNPFSDVPNTNINTTLDPDSSIPTDLNTSFNNRGQGIENPLIRTFDNSSDSTTLGGIVVEILAEISQLFITFVAGLSLITFMWGIVKYIWKGDSEDARQKGKKLMIWGIIGLFVMFSVWGIVGIIGETFGVETVIPQFRGN